MNRHPSSFPGVLLALLALVMQLAYGATVPRESVPSPLQAANFICHADDDGQSPSRAPSRDCGLCPLCVLRVAPAMALPAGAPVLVPSRLAFPWHAGPHPLAQAIHPVPGTDAQPRGPPFLA